MKIQSLCKYLGAMLFLCGIIITQASYGDDGKWEQKDKQDNMIVFEWYQFNGDTVIPYLKKKKELAEVIAKSMKSHVEYVVTELDKKNLINTSKSERFRNDFTEFLQHTKDGTIVEYIKQTVITECDQGILKFSLPNQAQESGEAFIVVARELNGKILGFADFKEQESGKVLLDDLGVMPETRMRGIGKILVFSVLKLRPFTQEIILDTATDDKVFYEKLGFELYEESLEGIGLKFRYIVQSIKQEQVANGE